MNQELTIGRIVHYVVDRDLGEHRPAIVTHVWDDTLCNLRVFTDGPNDAPNVSPFWVSSVENDEEFKEQGTWHWPEREE